MKLQYQNPNFESFLETASLVNFLVETYKFRPGVPMNQSFGSAVDGCSKSRWFRSGSGNPVNRVQWEIEKYLIHRL